MSTRHAEHLVPLERLTRPPIERNRRAASVDGAPAPLIDVERLWRRLRREVEGEVRFDDGSRGLYAQDASNYFHVPLGVVVPKSAADVAAVLSACSELGAPVVSRAGGTALAGQAANEALLIDFSKYMNHILELDPATRRARVEPGVICDQLVDAARPHGLTWGPKPATHDHCCFGGMLGNNCGGMHAQYAGTAVHNVESMRALTYDGTLLELGPMRESDLEEKAARGGSQGRMFSELRAFRQHYAALIRDGFPDLPRRISGYNLNELLCNAEGSFNLARALVGSEGTCVTLLDATVCLVDEYPERAVVVMSYEDVFRAGDHVLDVLEFSPLAVEGMDHMLYEHVTKKHLRQQKYLSLLPQGRGWLLVELGAHDRDELRARAERLAEKLRDTKNPPCALKLIEDKEEQEHLWKVRESGLGATAFVPGQPDAWPGFEDSAVRPEQFGSYLRDVRELFRKHGYSPSLYGHFGMGCLHCRVNFDLTSAAGIKTYRAFMDEAADLVAVKYRGSLSGEHGDGQARGELLVKMFGPELVQAFHEFKGIWDPRGKMNPGRIVGARPFDVDLRLGAAYDPSQPETHFKFPEDHGSFARATLRCVGVGKCRRLDGKPGEDTMCPSFMVTREEKHSTRGRAHLLWEMLRGEGTPIHGQWRDENVKEALDLCLACKGCKGDCPVNVDVATYKAEFLSHYYRGKLRPRSAYAFGLIDRWARMASVAPNLVNVVTQTPGLSRLAKLAAGMAPERSIPAFAPQTFRAWFQRRGPRARGGPRVLLWPDTFNNYFYPDTARAAVEVLEHLGFDVEIPSQVLCCGRPLYDFGMLNRAAAYLENVLRVLQPHVAAGTPVVVLEPSCCSVFRDEMRGLLPNRVEARNLQQQTFLFSEFVLEHARDKLPKLERKALIQGHCHHKSVLRFDAEAALLAAMQVDAELLNSGCCGMAGSFGFEREKYDVSRACGERVLLPQVRRESAETVILADGFSCRTQIEQNTERSALHVAEAMKLALEHGPAGPPTRQRPEHEIVKRRRRAVNTGMLRLGIGSALVISAAIGFSFFFRRPRSGRSRLRISR
jgi:FAD/FMN-containing dehydrogenase/Fe-S oxidoreductase